MFSHANLISFRSLSRTHGQASPAETVRERFSAAPAHIERNTQGLLESVFQAFNMLGLLLASDRARRPS
jgi:hypothetical protein